MRMKNSNQFRELKSIAAVLLVFVMIVTSVIVIPSKFTTAATTTATVAAPAVARDYINLFAGKKYTMNISNAVKGSTYQWSTSNKKVVTVSKKGVITGVSKGKVTITCKITASKKKYTTKCSVNVLKALSASVEKSQKTAIEITKDMGNGWNLANTLEAIPSTVTSSTTVKDCETAWGMPVTTKAMIDGVKAAGFNSVRIPVAWSTLMSKDGKYTINADFMKRVDEVINYVLDDGMYAVVNDHWDNGWWNDFGDPNDNVKKEAMKKYEAMWTQIAEHYANYSNKLIFESANEELGYRFNEKNTGTMKKLTLAEEYDTTNKINQKFVDVVRAAGGNNTTRYLLIAGFNTDIANTCDDWYKMPEDIIAKHLMVSVHYYSPRGYCLESSVDVSWGTDLDKRHLRDDLTRMEKFTKAGYGVVLGEYSPVNLYVDGKSSLKQNADLYIQNVVSLCKELNIVPMLWDHGYYLDRQNNKLRDDSIAAIFKK